jgi:S1-C subfamily serine protease
MTSEQKGVLVRAVQPTSHAHGVLFPGDILMRFDGVDVASEGTVPFRSGERIAFSEWRRRRGWAAGAVRPLPSTRFGGSPPS